MNRNLQLGAAAFAAGAFAILWVGAGYVGGGALALAMTGLIAVAYAVGGLELLRFHQATAALERALAAPPRDPDALAAWLGGLPAALRHPVRQRIEGERGALPGPSMTPYLVGLLVMLGMLGTFLGMVVTLNGAVIALEGATDLQTMRNTLSAPVKGLGLAFGTSVAGVAASAMLGLVSALCRRERLAAAQRLDALVGGELRGFSLVHQRQETYRALQVQSQALPELATGMRQLMEQMARQHEQLSERLLAGQETFHREAKAVYGELAASVDRSLKGSLADGARLAGEGMRPVVEATLAGLARESGELHRRIADAAAGQFAAAAERFDAAAARVADTWAAALQKHEAGGERIAGHLRETLDGFATGFDSRTRALLADVANAQAAQQAEIARAHAAQQAELLRVQAAQQAEIAQAQAAQRAEFAAQERERAAAFAAALDAMTKSLQQEWRAAGAEAATQQQRICDSFDRSARELTEQAQVHARETIAEVTRLMQTAAEAPRAAAEVVGQLRQELSNSMARDNALLEERARILGTLNGLLDAINHAAAEQKAAIDALVEGAAGLLERRGQDFAAQADAVAGRIDGAAAQVAAGAAEVASLGDALGAAVQQFGAANEALVGHLQRIDGALDKSMARSDEQLAYYVAQAREVIDLAVLSQQRIVDELKRRAADPEPEPFAEAA